MLHGLGLVEQGLLRETMKPAHGSAAGGGSIMPVPAVGCATIIGAPPLPPCAVDGGGALPPAVIAGGGLLLLAGGTIGCMAGVPAWTIVLGGGPLDCAGVSLQAPVAKPSASAPSRLRN